MERKMLFILTFDYQWVPLGTNIHIISSSKLIIEQEILLRPISNINLIKPGHHLMIT